MSMAEIKDATGRIIEVRTLDVLTRRRFTRACGQAADIDRWFGEALVAAHARTIDGVPMIMPQTPDQADALVAKLGTEGVTAIGEWLQEAHAQTSADAEIAAAKNSLGTPNS